MGRDGILVPSQPNKTQHAAASSASGELYPLLYHGPDRTVCPFHLTDAAARPGPASARAGLEVLTVSQHCDTCTPYVRY